MLNADMNIDFHVFTEKTRDLWRFVHGGNSKSSITSRTLQFLERHQHRHGVSSRSVIKTFRETATQWVQWRSKSSKKKLHLEMIERKCSTSMEINGYRPLKYFSNVRNLSLPSIDNLNCTFTGC